MRLAEWQEQIKEKTDQLEKELTKQIVQHSGKEGGVLALGYAPNDPCPLTPAIEQAVRKDRVISAANLTPALQQLLRDAVAEQAKNPNDEQLRDDSASIDIYWQFAFQLPNGAILQHERGSLGSYRQYSPAQETNRAANGVGAAAELKPFARHPLPAGTNPRVLFLAPRHSQDAVDMAQTAHSLGFTELILYTDDRTVLKAAIAEAGKTRGGTGNAQPSLRVCAAVAPFAPAPNEARARTALM